MTSSKRTSDAHQNIHQAADEIAGFGENLGLLWDAYKTRGNLQDGRSRELLKEMAGQAGVSVGDLVGYIRMTMSGDRDPGDVERDYQKEKQTPHITNSKNTQKTSARGTKMANRRAKLDIMTGFSGVEKIDGDQGSKGSGYFPKWTTVGLPDQGRNSAIDDDQQPTGAGAPETSFPGNPLKVPMEADDVKRPKIREGREASIRKLQRVAGEIRLLDPPLSRRLMAAAEELAYDDLSTAALDVSGDESNDVDDHQDGGGHGTLKFFGTDPARSTSLTRKSSRRVRANPCEVKETNEGFIVVDDNGKKVGGPYDSESEANEAKLEFVKEEVGEGAKKGTLEYASRRGSRRRRADDDATNPVQLDNQASYWHRKYPDVDLTTIYALLEDRQSPQAIESFLQRSLREKKRLQQPQQQQQQQQPQQQSSRHRLSSQRRLATGDENKSNSGLKNINWKNTLDLVESAIQGHYDSKSVSNILDSDYKRTRQLLDGNTTSPAQAAGPYVRNGDNVTSSRRRRLARAQGDAPLKPIAAPPDEDGVGADGAGGFAHRSKAPLQKSMNADDVERPRIRENPEASKSLWAAFKNIITKKGDVGGTWNDGRYTISSRDYGNTLEVSASVKDREGIHMPVGSMTISLINDSPSGRFASVELNDGLIENRVLEFTMKPKMARKVASWIFQETADVSKETLEHMGVS